MLKSLGLSGGDTETDAELAKCGTDNNACVCVAPKIQGEYTGKVYAVKAENYCDFAAISRGASAGGYGLWCCPAFLIAMLAFSGWVPTDEESILWLGLIIVVGIALTVGGNWFTTWNRNCRKGSGNVGSYLLRATKNGKTLPDSAEYKGGKIAGCEQVAPTTPAVVYKPTTKRGLR